MNWQKSSDTSMRCAPWTVSKVLVRDVLGYELWHDKMDAMIGRFPSFEAAKDEVRCLEEAGQA